MSLQITALTASRGFSLASGAAVAALWAGFSVAHIAQFQRTGEIALLLVVMAETLAAVFYLVRSAPRAVSTDPLDWAIAIAGTFSPLFFRPADHGVLPLASYAMIPGLVLQVLALLSLNRSFAIVAATRSIKTTRLYAVVRHPLYASYCLLFTSYVLVHTSLQNMLVLAALISLMLLRILREERHLARDPRYANYMQAVRFRLIPFLY